MKLSKCARVQGILLTYYIGEHKKPDQFDAEKGRELLLIHDQNLCSICCFGRGVRIQGLQGMPALGLEILNNKHLL